MSDKTNPIRNDRDMMWIALVLLVPVAYHYLVEEISANGQRLLGLAFFAGYSWLCIARLRDVVEEQEKRIWQLESQTGITATTYRLTEAGESELTLASRVKDLESQIRRLQQ